MSSQRPPRTATAYLQITTAPYGKAKVVKSTQKKPEVIAADCIVVKVELRIPAEAWDPFQPEAVIDVPADLVQHPIEVEAVDPS